MNEQDLSDFGGVARLFPLPNFVLFPHVVKPLHIFEPRYLQMTEDALRTDRLIALVLLKPGWEPDYEGRPEVYDVACLARIIHEQQLEDGKYNILVRGLCRLRLEGDLPSDKRYRCVQGWPLPDGDHPKLQNLRRAIGEAVRKWVSAKGSALKQLNEILEGETPLGALCDLLSFALPLDAEVKQGLLEELDVEQRARRLVEELDSAPELLHMPRQKPKFPPDFSLN